MFHYKNVMRPWQISANDRSHLASFYFKQIKDGMEFGV